MLSVGYFQHPAGSGWFLQVSRSSFKEQEGVRGHLLYKAYRETGTLGFEPGSFCLGLKLTRVSCHQKQTLERLTDGVMVGL